MKQVVQSFKTGRLEVAEVPVPVVLPGMIRVRSTASAISVGTERMVIELARKSLAGKAKERPDLVRKVLAKLRRDGLVATIKEVTTRLDRSVALGYSASGVVEETGAGADEFRPGDRVACAGAGYAAHAEYVVVPTNLAVKVPEGVPDADAAFATIGAIAMHGFRCAEVSLGETVAVIGLGLVGQFAVQIARAAGCRVVAADIDPEKVELARRVCPGIEGAVIPRDDMGALVTAQSAGADAVIIAAATKSKKPIELAGEIARDRGRIVALGAISLDIPRDLFYRKELSLIVSRSYGPGRHDPDYEEKGFDYPLGYVRWTERRNLEEFVEMLSRGTVAVAPLVTHTFPIDRALEAYDLVTGGAGKKHLGIVLTYPLEETPARTVEIARGAGRRGTRAGRVGVAVVGTGNFSRGVLIPALAATAGVELVECVSARGTSAASTAKRFGFRRAGCDFDAMLTSDEVDAVVIATPHNEHARQAAAALRAGKHVFVEKPLAIREEELDDVSEAIAQGPGFLMVGYNRRFAPATGLIKEFMKDRGEPLTVLYRVNAGRPPEGGWLADPQLSGGRVLGEVCHFVDWVLCVTGARPRTVYAQSLSSRAGAEGARDDISAQIGLSDGSMAGIVYCAGGSAAVDKEYIEVAAAGRTAIVYDFRRVALYTGSKKRVLRYGARMKGHAEEIAAFIKAVRGWPDEGGVAPIPTEEMLAVSRVTFALARSARSGRTVSL